MSDVVIKYRQSEIAAMNDSGQKTLHTSQKYCESDIEIVYTKPTFPTFATEEKTVTPTTSVQNITPSNGIDGLSKVVVNPIPSNYVIPSGTVQITTNGSHPVSGKATAEVNVPIPTFVTIYRGSTEPASSLGQNGDLYLKV